MSRVVIFFLVVLLINESSLFAAPITVHSLQDGITIDASLEPSTCTVGDIITLQIVALSASNQTLELAETEAFGSFTILEQHRLLDIPNGAGRKWIWLIQLDTFDASTTSLEGITIAWSDASDNEGAVTLDPFPVQIETVAGKALEELKLRDIKSMVPLIRPQNWALGIGILIFIAFVVWLVRKATRKPPERELAHELALQALAKLRDSQLEVLPFYTALSSIVREYLVARFEIAATGQTTNEFLIAAKQHPHLEHNDQKQLGIFLKTADMVKFAMHVPSGRICNAALDQAEEFISSTKPNVVQHTASKQIEAVV